MLIHLLIRDFAIIDRLELDLQTGMTALTGETGAGKSILIDAIGLVLGDRADSAVVRTGCARAEISATFDLDQLPDVHAWLAERDFDSGGECVIRRVISQDGRSRAYLNGSPTTLLMLRELGERLVNIHGQQAHQALGHRDYQRGALDLQTSHEAALRALAEIFRAWQQTSERLEALNVADDQRQERLDFIGFQLSELQAAAPETGEFVMLTEQHARLAHAGRLLESTQQAHALLFDADPDVHSLLTQALGALEEAAGHDNALAGVLELLRNARIEIDEAAGELRHYLDGLQLDPERLEAVESRIALLQSLARKHRCEVEALPDRLSTLNNELDALSHADEQRTRLARDLARLEADWRTQAAAISAARQQTASTLAEAVSAAMQELGMEGGRFAIDIEADAEAKPSLHGLDRIEFRVSANPGQPLQPLGKVASGGELSRISLAVQLAATQDRRIPILIFDEVDSGIGGSVAEVVGRMLRALGARHQVLCVTHLPQVAAQAHQHLAVTKTKSADSTQTRIVTLAEPTQRIEELARMLGGVRMTEQTRAHAKEMLHIAQNSN